ncbi:MAG: thioesterase family protein [Chitinophagales bacterium]
MMYHYKLKFPLQIRFVDLDSLGHVNNSNYLTYFEIARIQYFEEIIAEGRVNWKKEGIILAKAIIDFREPISTYLNYFISICCSRIGTRSFDFNYLITKDEGNESVIIAEGTTVMVCFDYESQQTITMKAEWREAINKFEGRKL